MIGDLIGSYRVVRKLGEGGMGVVYEAVHEQIGRRGAIKVLHPEFSRDEQIAARFFNEARAVNIIQHSGVVGIFEFGYCADRSAYLVMEYLEGESLAARIAKNRADKTPAATLVAQTARLGRQIALTLAATHAHGIVHRDLKPDNVMIVAEPEMTGGERTKLLDFGIAKLQVEGAGPGPGPGPGVKTRTGVLMGTPAYMAPEQCRGIGAVDAKADVYSLGVIFYEMLGGQLPFSAQGVGEMIGMQLYAKPKELHELVPALPALLCALVHRMLAKDPTQRPTMQEVAAALSEAHATPPGITGQPQVPLAPAREEQAGRRRSMLVRVLAAGVVLAGAAAGLSWRLSGRAQQDLIPQQAQGAVSAAPAAPAPALQQQAPAIATPAPDLASAQRDLASPADAAERTDLLRPEQPGARKSKRRPQTQEPAVKGEQRPSDESIQLFPD